MCVEVGRVRVDEARDRLRNQNNTLQHDFSLVSYIIKIKLSFRIKKRFLVIGRQFIICVSNKDIKSHRLNIYFKIRSIERDENCKEAL